MVVYLSGLIMTLPLVYITMNKRKDKLTIFLGLLSIIPFSLISGLRYYVGTDYDLYRVVFTMACKGEDVPSSLIEPGYFFLNKVIAFFTDNYVYLFLITAFLTIGTFFGAIYLLSVNPVYSIFLWFISLFYFESMNTVRQSYVVALFFLGIYFLYVGNKILYLLLFLLAYSIHRSAIVFLPIMFVCKFKFQFRRQIEILAIVFLLAYFSKSIVNHMPLIFVKYQSYYNDNRFVDFRLADFIIMVVVWIFGMYNQQFVSEKRKKIYGILLNLQYFGVAISAVSGILPMAYRVLMYFKYIPLLYVPEIIFTYKQKKNNKVIVSLFVIFLYIAQWAYYALGLHYTDFIRYVSIFNH